MDKHFVKVTGEHPTDGRITWINHMDKVDQVVHVLFEVEENEIKYLHMSRGTSGEDVIRNSIDILSINSLKRKEETETELGEKEDEFTYMIG